MGAGSVPLSAGYSLVCMALPEAEETGRAGGWKKMLWFSPSSAHTSYTT